MASTQPPKDRNSFRVAIVCALPREADAVTLLFDEFWDEISDPYGREDSDTNTYITGRIGRHNVVLVTLPGPGTNNAAAGAAYLTLSYRNLKLALLVGTCGGMPRINDMDAYLGDVVISKTIIQYDFGRLYPGHFIIKDAPEDRIGRANKDIRTMLASFEMEFMRKRLKIAATSHLSHLQEVAKEQDRKAEYQYPGTKQDRLFPPDYSHNHRKSCSVCSDDSNVFCEAAFKYSCIEAGCDLSKLIPRDREDDLPEGADFTPEIFIGRLGSANQVVKSGVDRDELAARHDLDAFEMEGAGIWDEIPTMIIKGISGYADSHRNEAWKDFAAATAASVAKAILGRYPSGNSVQPSAPVSGQQDLNERSVASNSLLNATWSNQGHIAGDLTYMPGPVQLPGESNATNPSRFLLEQ
ncbi:nucleoside phosphorylase domain-containing protein [Fusarium redolens]|uniref:Nucleoside phosphorylase domain-containing protein n=1 Tax=Fusarium redolens TaxID=48865 RepID=A0A9P9GJW3_FUSRE|nr:nucleoside phosphorylase domain-containing protein [Fusarium redolens]KAH7240276.1 nucleoside phosphorylase domain-containing protein [Fusarium redolens]